MTFKVQKAVKELNKPQYVFLGSVPDVLEKFKIFDKKEIKEVMDNTVFPLSNKQRGFVYEQMETRKERAK